MLVEKILQKRGKGTQVRTLEQLREFKPTKRIALDIETFGDAKLPGDSPFAPAHGIVGLGAANQEGDAVYILVDDAGGKRPGVPVRELAAYCNEHWLTAGREVVFHNAKFDLGFLQARGFNFLAVKLVDTWIMHSIYCQGVFSSNKLKDIMASRFGFAVDSETVIKDWLASHGTEDYGDIPADLIAPYTCDDVRYALALYQSLENGAFEQWEHHDRFLALTLRILEMEALGIRVDAAAVRAVMELGRAKLVFHRAEVVKALTSAKVDLDDEQAMLHYLHQAGMHPSRTESYGEVKYVFDREALSLIQAPLALHYKHYYLWKTFIEQFSPATYRGLKARITRDQDGSPVMHGSWLLSIFSRGGEFQVRRPDLQTVLGLNDVVRGFFKPRPGMHFVQVSPVDYPVRLLAYYMKDTDMQARVQSLSGDALCRHYAVSKLAPEAVSLFFDQVLRGYGNGRLLERMQCLNLRVSKGTLEAERTKFFAQFPGWNDFKKRLLAVLESQSGRCRDVTGAPITVGADRRYRAPAILLMSGAGNVVSTYLKAICDFAAGRGARLVFGRENEFLFEAPDGSKLGDALEGNVLNQALTLVPPRWRVWDQEREGGKWVSPGDDAHQVAATIMRDGGPTVNAKGVASGNGSNS